MVNKKTVTIEVESVIYLFSLFDAIFSQNTYPPSWQIAIIFPFLKPNADPTLPVSYRPIALTSVLGETVPKNSQ